MVTDGRSVRLGRPEFVEWLPDGRLLAQRSTYTQAGRDRGLTGRSLEVVDPLSGEVRAGIPVDVEKNIGGVTRRGDRDAPGMRARPAATWICDQVESIAVSESAVETDQLDIHPGEVAFQLHHNRTRWMG